jgi:hypothetical protein
LSIVFRVWYGPARSRHNDLPVAMELLSDPAPILAEVAPGLWVCGEAALPTALAYGITHLVSLGYPPPQDLTGAGDDDDEDESGVLREVLRVELEDDDDGDLLTQIPDVTAFITDGLRLREATRALAAAAVNADATSTDDGSASTTGGGGGGGGGGGNEGGGDCNGGGGGGGGGGGVGGGGGFGGVVVHCHAGVSRSVAVVVAHIMRTRHLDPDQALAVGPARC